MLSPHCSRRFMVITEMFGGITGDRSGCEKDITEMGCCAICPSCRCCHQRAAARPSEMVDPLFGLLTSRLEAVCLV
jgi:hypothetical protein